jgi:hypothetical protein
MQSESKYNGPNDEQARRLGEIESLSDLFGAATVAEVERFCALRRSTDDLAPVGTAHDLVQMIRDFETPITNLDIADHPLVVSLLFRINSRPIVALPFHLQVLAAWFDFKGEERAADHCRLLARRITAKLDAIAADIGALKAVIDSETEGPPSGA